jgi:FkbM family methyltransferase
MFGIDIINKLLSKIDVRLTRNSTFQKLFEKSFLCEDYIQQIEVLYTSKKLHKLQKSKSQLGLRQDLFVLAQLDFKENGFFVEFGAANGVELSNTHILEKEFGWDGILAEPARCWHENIRKYRKCHIETDCVWRDSNTTLTFNEVDVGELSTINLFSSNDTHTKTRENFKEYDVNTISLIDLLDKYHAPKNIDFLSIDTEGSEYEILSSFDYDKYQFKIITCEHNDNIETREKIAALLGKNGYVRKFENLSKCDDWYLKLEEG